MIAGVRGRLITASFADAVLLSLPGAAAPGAATVRALEGWADRRDTAVGPASSVRAITDAVVIPLLRILGFEVARRLDQDARSLLEAEAPSPGACVPVLIVRWSEPLDRAWRSVVLEGVRIDARWCFCCNGTALRIVDAHRTWARRYLEFDLALLAREDATRTILWSIARADSLAARPPLLERAVELSARHGVAVCRALGGGVLEALALVCGALGRRRGADPHAVFEGSLTVLYRVLFLLFAEARGLVPVWHPVYRDRYSLDTIVAALLAGRRYRGVWQAVQAISRLAHAGCAAGELRVTAFNGRLFSPAHARVVDGVPIEDEVMGRAVLAVSTVSGAGGGSRARIAYRDLDVEQLGTVYEHVLDHHAGATPIPRRTRDARKSSGTFYTPRAITAYLVRRTLEPLVRDRGADDILRLRIVDPAMGSGAFLVAACRYLAAAAEDALVREGRWHQSDVTPADRVALRREIALRCLYGVDLNPMAVQVARLSLWLATLASDRPLTFLDHHLVTGDSLIGATPADVQRQPSRGRRSTRRPQPLPLFAAGDLTAVLEHAARARVQLALAADESAAIVRGKEHTLAALHARDAPLGRWWHVLDLWCAGWFWDAGDPPDAGAFADLSDLLLQGRSALPPPTAARLLARADAIAARSRFLHWPLAFPEVFCDARGDTGAGFDAVIGNPPWDMVRGDSGEGAVRDRRREDARRFTDFVREAGVYRVDSRSHVNRYQLFVERALQLIRAGGRVGLVLPAGLATDTGAAPLRRHLFDRADVDTLTGLANRAGIFPIHRSVRFVLLACTAGRPTARIGCRFGITAPEDLEAPGDRHAPLVVTRRFLARVSGEDDLGIPEMTGGVDLAILEKISARHPWLGKPDGWHVEFGRELNASDDRRSFAPFGGAPEARPVLEGKQIEPFRVALDRCRFELARGAAKPVARRARLAYRDVASATNRLTLIAAIVPPRAVTTHTLFCLKTLLPADAQLVLCALLNSFVANYLVRLRVNTHVTVSLVSRLPVPVVPASDPAFARLAYLARTLSASAAPLEALPEYVELQALAARLYGLDAAEFAHVLSTFPLIGGDMKSAALGLFNRVG